MSRRQIVIANCTIAGFCKTLAAMRPYIPSAAHDHDIRRLTHHPPHTQRSASHTDHHVQPLQSSRFDISGQLEKFFFVGLPTDVSRPFPYARLRVGTCITDARPA